METSGRADRAQPVSRYAASPASARCLNVAPGRSPLSFTSSIGPVETKLRPASRPFIQRIVGEFIAKVDVDPPVSRAARGERPRPCRRWAACGSRS